MYKTKIKRLEEDDRPSILFIIKNSALNRGMNTGIENLAWGLAEHNFNVHILSGGSNPRSHQYDFPSNVNYHFIGKSGDNPRNFSDHIIDIIREYKINVIIGWIFNLAPLHRLVTKNFSNVLFVANQGQLAPRSIMLSLVKRAIRGMVSLTDAMKVYYDIGILKRQNLFHQIVSISNAVQRSCIKAYSLDPKKCRIIYEGIDINKYSYVEKDYSKNKVTLLFAGNVQKAKGIDDLVNSLNFITKPVELVLCGNAKKEYIDSLINKIKHNKKRHKITYAGTQSPENLVKLYHECDIFVFPSHSEGLGKALIEAMSCGCPVITSNIDVFKEIVKNEYNGLIANVRDPEDLAKQINKYINNPSLRKKCGYNARKTIEDKFNKELFIQQWCQLLDDLYIQNKVKL
jgi:glycosyltransferase involved in cell wall biosynthesis